MPALSCRPFSDDLITQVRVLLCDADGNLFPSEEPAFEASAGVTNEFLRSLGVRRRRTADELRRTTTGLTFRRTATALAAEYGIADVEDLDSWVEREKEVVTAHLAATLAPDEDVLEPLRALGAHFDLAAVSSSARTRLDRCFGVTGLDGLFPPDRLFSAEDSLPVPTSKPDPAIYRHACASLGIEPSQGLAIEDSVPGATSAIAAGCATVGNVHFVPSAERGTRARALREAGVIGVVTSWRDLAGVVLPGLTGGSQEFA